MRTLITSHILSHHPEEITNGGSQKEGVPPFNMCEECGATFKKPAHLKQHLQSHSLEKSNLCQHVKAVHEELKPFACCFSGCGMRFSYKHVRDKHEKSGCHVYVAGDFEESDEQFQSRPRGGRKRRLPTIEMLIRKRILTVKDRKPETWEVGTKHWEKKVQTRGSREENHHERVGFSFNPIFYFSLVPQKRSILCRSSTGPGAPNSGAIALSISCTRFPLVHFSGGDNESRNVLDAFFLGKALAEALNERIESTIGEFLSTVGRLQAEQQKQVLDFQEEVLERAKRAKEKAAREALEAQGLILKSTAVNSTSVTNGAASKASPSTSDDGVSANLSSDNPANPAAYTDPNPAKGE
ncbi:hypothetical protein COLO4_10043 [Corchorus olitorius]|uniref:C2H2-type domain-containing protein n=1 Tax=Corchorus olitorius TaxID=93759 RepID=A0A1R3KA50_9ROSI|nr:hypothetical protein COLO4_10043 [Corchorus olitorius]